MKRTFKFSQITIFATHFSGSGWHQIFGWLGVPVLHFLGSLPQILTTEIFSSHEINVFFSRHGNLRQKHCQELRFTTFALPLSTEQKQNEVERRRGHNLVCACTKQFINTTFLREKSGEFSKVSEVISQTGFGTWLIAFWKTLKPPELQQS